MPRGNRTLAAALHVHHPDAATRMRAATRWSLTYAIIVIGTLAAIPISFIPGGPLVAPVVLITDLVFVGAALLLRSGRVDAGLAVFFTAFIGSFVPAR